MLDTPSVSDSRMNSWRVSSHYLAGAGEEVDGVAPFRLGQVVLDHEPVQVLDQVR